MRWFKRPDFDVEKSLKVKFLDELRLLSADFGGQSSLLPSPDVAKLANKSVYNAGRLISSVIAMVNLLHACFTNFLRTMFVARQFRKPKTYHSQIYEMLL